MKRILPALLVITALLLGCTETKIDPEQKLVSEQLTALQTDFDSYKSKIEAVYWDLGLKNQLIEEKELLRSRIERLKAYRKSKGWKNVEEAAPAKQAAH